MRVEIKIEKDVPVPEYKRGRHTIFPWKQMAPGDSFFAPGYVAHHRQAKNGEAVLNPNYARRSVPGTKWAGRTVTENGVLGVRVWRLA